MEKPYFIIPLAGFGLRFSDNGFDIPKQLLKLDNHNCIEKSLDAISNLREFHVIAFVRDPEVLEAMNNILKSRCDEFTVIKGYKTSSPMHTLSEILDKVVLNDNANIYIYTLDVDVKNKIKLNQNISDPHTYVFKANSPSYSYVKLNDQGNVIQVAEKHVISDLANLGLYCFGNVANLKIYLPKVLEKFSVNQADANIIDLYSEMILAGFNVRTKLLNNVYIFGTPDEYFFCKNNIYKYFNLKTVYLISDHSGYKMKEKFNNFFKKNNFEVIDLGCFDERDCDYSDYVEKVNQCRNDKPGFVFGSCRTGQGINSSMNKILYGFSALVYSEESFMYAISHNASVNFSFPEKLWLDKSLDFIPPILDNFDFEGGRHQNRIIKTLNYQNGKKQKN